MNIKIINQLKNITWPINKLFKLVIKKPFAIFILLVVVSLAWASYIFYQKAFVITNASPTANGQMLQIDTGKLTPIKKIINARQTNIDTINNQNISDPFNYASEQNL